MAKSFREFKKQLEMKKEQEETLRTLNSAVSTLSRKRDSYIEQSKTAKRLGNDSQYRAMVALLKNAMFNLAQAQDMVANFTIAKDMCEMQQLNKKFVRSLDSVMKNVYKTCKAINVSSSEKTFMKALYQQNITSMQLQQALKDNNTAFSSSVNSISDISDEEVGALLNDGINDEVKSIDNTLDALEAEFNAPSAAVNTAPARSMEGMADGSASYTAPRASSGAKPSFEIPDFGENKSGFNPVPKPTEPEGREGKEIPEKKPLEASNKKNTRPEDKVLGASGGEESSVFSEYKFNWEELPSISFEDIAGLEDVKDIVRVKVLLPLKNPEAFEGYEKKNGGGMCLYGPPGTGKTMIAAAIANEIGAKFCSIKPSDLLQQGQGQTEKAVRALFAQAREFPCAVIYFDEMDSLTPKNTKSTAARQLRSEFLAQLQGIDSYKKGEDRILFLVAATNKPWDIDSAFLRPGRFGTKVYVGLPDYPAREYMIRKRIEKILKKGVVQVNDDVNIEALAESTNGFNCSDITNLLDRIEEISIIRGIKTGEKYISDEDFAAALTEIHSSVQADDIQKLKDWREENDQ